MKKRQPGRDEEYYHPEQVLMRRCAPDLCCDDDCELSNGAAHAGPCEPCDCEINDWGRPTKHAVMECPKNFPNSEFTIEERVLMYEMRTKKKFKKHTRKEIVDYVAKRWPVTKVEEQ